MRHKYATTALIIGKVPVGEASAMIPMLSPDLGYLWARAQSIRMSQSKLTHALQLLCVSDVSLVEGKQCFKITGALLVKKYTDTVLEKNKRQAVYNAVQLFFSLVHEASPDSEWYELFVRFLDAVSLEEGECSTIEYAMALALLHKTGHLASLPVPLLEVFTIPMYDYIKKNHHQVVRSINHGIQAAKL